MPKVAKAAKATPATRAKKVKNVKKKISMPDNVWALVKALRKRAAALQIKVKRRDILNASLKALSALGDKALAAAMSMTTDSAQTEVKTGDTSGKKTSKLTGKKAGKA